MSTRCRAAFIPEATSGGPGAIGTLGPMEEPDTQDPVRPEVVDAEGDDGSMLLDGSKLRRIASMTRAMLEEARSAPLEPAGRKRLGEIYERSLEELGSALPTELRSELDTMFLPLVTEVPSEAELRIAQAQLVG